MDDPLISFRIPSRVLEESRLLLVEPGLEELEAVVLWIGRHQSEDLVEILAAHMPEQVAFRTEFGVGVTVVDEALSALIAALPEGMFVPVRLHTHPAEAFHSSTDDDNMLLSHRGAISIVVPNFARERIEFTRCSVNELDHRHRWRELDRREVEARFMVP
jgi:hypothetical protein